MTTMPDMAEAFAGKYKFSHTDGFRLGTDTVLLSAYAKLRRGMKICDLGCGSGALSLLLASRHAGTSIVGVEVQEASALAAKGNIRQNGLEDRLSVINHDLRQIKDILPSGSFDLVISNPPYFEKSRGKSPEAAELKSARSDYSCTLGDVCAAASYLTRWGGRFVLIFRTERLVELFCLMRGHGLEPKRARFIKARTGSEPSLVLIDAKRGGGSGLMIEQDLILYDADGSESAELKKIYMRGRE